MTDARYDIRTEVQYGPLERIDVKAIADGCRDRWWNRTLCRVNDCVARLGVIDGEFHWHKHDDEDELFYVLEGKLLVDVQEEEQEARTAELDPGQAFVVPKGVVHRTRTRGRTVILMFEGAGVEPTGD